MIHDVPNQLKFKRFVRVLRPLCQESILATESVAVAILERLWHAAIDNAQAGDIGKLSDDDIAEAVGWLGDASSLIGALVESRWLDRCEVHRLIIHDWHEHCPNFVKGNFVKHNKKFAIATCLSSVPKQPAQYDEQPALAPIPNLTKPNLTDLTEPNGTPASLASQDFLKERWETIREIANNVHAAIDPGRRLSAQNRELVLKVACLATASESLSKVVDKQVGATKTKLASASPPRHPWGWFKARIIKAVNASGEDFDFLWDSIELPAEILKPVERATA